MIELFEGVVPQGPLRYWLSQEEYRSLTAGLTGSLDNDLAEINRIEDGPG